MQDYMYWRNPAVKFEDFVGKTFSYVEAVRNDGDDRIVFRTNDNEEIIMYHSSDCCESVYIEDINGDLDILVGEPILHAEESVSVNEWPTGIPTPEWVDDSYTWTFYRISTIKGTVVIRWFGSSNGYYSESVSIVQVRPPNA
jgi:hypothetical protein